MKYTMFQGNIQDAILSQFRTDFQTQKKMVELAE